MSPRNRPRRQPPAARWRRGLLPALIGAGVLLLAGFVALGGPSRGGELPAAAIGLDARSKGSANAPVVVEDWSDFG